jgi:hypothetical protein
MILSVNLDILPPISSFKSTKIDNCVRGFFLSSFSYATKLIVQTGMLYEQLCVLLLSFIIFFIRCAGVSPVMYACPSATQMYLGRWGGGGGITRRFRDALRRPHFLFILIFFFFCATSCFAAVDCFLPFDEALVNCPAVRWDADVRSKRGRRLRKRLKYHNFNTTDEYNTTHN